MPATLPTIRLDDLATVTGGQARHRRPPAPGDHAPGDHAPVTPEPPVTPGPGAGVGRTASSYRPGSRY